MFSTSCGLEGYRVEISYVCEHSVSPSTRSADGEDRKTPAAVQPSQSQTIADERKVGTTSERLLNSELTTTSEKLSSPEAQIKTTSNIVFIQQAKDKTSKSFKLTRLPTTTRESNTRNERTLISDYSIPTTPPLNPLSQETTKYRSVTVSRSLDNNECVRDGDYNVKNGNYNAAAHFCLNFVSGDEPSRMCYQV